MVTQSGGGGGGTKKPTLNFTLPSQAVLAKNAGIKKPGLVGDNRVQTRPKVKAVTRTVGGTPTVKKVVQKRAPATAYKAPASPGPAPAPSGSVYKTKSMRRSPTLRRRA